MSHWNYNHVFVKNTSEDASEKVAFKSDRCLLQEASWLSWIFEKLVLLMVAYFVLSILNSMAQSYHKRLSKRTQEKPATD